MGGVDRFEVSSADGTKLAVWVGGEGPPLVLVHGSMQDHTGSAALIDALRGSLTTFAMDRRGFGASGDAAPYAIEREFEDVAAVVDDVAARTGGLVALWGHSYGASCAMGGATLTDRLSHLILYEPSLGLDYPDGAIEAVEAALAAGDDERAVLVVLEQVLELTDDEIEALRSSPTWPARVGTAPTVPRECRAEQEWVYRTGAFDAITAPTVLLEGSVSPPSLRKATADAVAAIPGARTRLLEGHAHLAHRTDPEMVAGIVTEIVAS